MSEKIFSGENSKDFWRAVRKAQIDILYYYGCKAQEVEQQRDDLLEACKYLIGDKASDVIAHRLCLTGTKIQKIMAIIAAIAKCS